MKKILLLALIAACTPAEHRAARESYNEGVALLQKADFDAAEKKLVEARNEAGVDPELRFRAAYDLGVAYAAHADKTKQGADADMAKALELEQQAVSWFFDAERLRPDDADVKTNLAIARARAAAISDQLRAGENKLEARLDAVIGEQRKLLDEARGAWAAVKHTGGADPLAQQQALVHLADEERGIVAEAGVITDLAGDEIDEIGKKPDDKRDEKEKVRVVQLKNLDVYLNEARAKIAEARSKLQQLSAEEGVSRAEAALVALKRAREQLLDPIAVLKELARDEVQMYQETGTAGEHAAPGSFLGSAAPPASKDPLPKWLEPVAIAGRQAGVRDRLEEIRARLEAGAQTEIKDDPNDKTGKAEQQKKLIERVKAALPFVIEASSDMSIAHDGLVAGKLEDAGKGEREALIALGRAIEQFADLKQTIDLAADTQHELVGLLGPEAAKALPPAERTERVKDDLTQNVARMPRLAELIGDELKQLESAPPPQANPKDPKGADAVKQKQEQLEQQKEQLHGAESLRADAEKALAKLEADLKAGKDPTASAKDAQDKLDQLRRLFFSVIEHLQELVRQQGETKDQTSQANAEDDLSRAPKLPGIAGRETEHGQMAKAITDALAAQADAAQKQQGQQQGPQAQQPGQIPPKTLAAAADEVRQAQGDMTDAGAAIGKAKESTTQTVSLEPAVKSEGKALDHLEAALKLLQPPKQNKDQQDQQKKQDQQKQDQQKQKDQQKQDQQQQQGGAGQRARDDDARRQRERKQREAGGDPVDQDW